LFHDFSHLIAGLCQTEIHSASTPGKPAYSDDGFRRKRSRICADRQKPLCKPRANCLKPKEIGRPRQLQHQVF
jgi:hypothetical protein